MSNKFLLLLVVVLGLILFSFACTRCKLAGTNQANTGAYTSLTPPQASAMIKSKEGQEDFVVLDVRTKEEFDEGHIKGAVNVDYKAPDFEAKVSQLDKNKTYLVYCRTGSRSAKASQKMQELGFKVLYNMDGGVKEWKKAGLPVVR